MFGGTTRTVEESETSRPKLADTTLLHFSEYTVQGYEISVNIELWEQEVCELRKELDGTHEHKSLSELILIK